MAPGTRQKVSQIESPRPSSCAAPSIWYAAVAAPKRNPGGNLDTRREPYRRPGRRRLWTGGSEFPLRSRRRPWGRARGEPLPTPTRDSRGRCATGRVHPSRTAAAPRRLLAAEASPESERGVEVEEVHVASSARTCRTDAGDEVAVPQRALLGGSGLGVEVDMDDAEALVVALLPFEVVQQRPHAIAAHVDAVGHRTGHGREVALQIGGPLGVLDVPVGGRRVVEGRAVLGDVDGQRLVVAAQPGQDLVQAVGVDLPAHGGGGRRSRGLASLEGQGAGGGGDPLRVVVVDAEEVDGGADHG